MASPTFINAFSSSYVSNTTASRTATLTTQAGDLVVAVGSVEGNNRTLNTPTGNSVTFALKTSIGTSGNASPIYIWTGVDSTGGTNWTLTLTRTGGATATAYGVTCLVFRGAAVGTSATGALGSGYTMSITPTQANSAIVTFITDWNANADPQSARVWETVNGNTPTSGNGMEVLYLNSSGAYTVYGAYYPDAGTTGSKTVGMSSGPTGPPTPATVRASLEVEGTTPTLPGLPWLRFT